jgi:hypothetical protein
MNASRSARPRRYLEPALAAAELQLPTPSSATSPIDTSRSHSARVLHGKHLPQQVLSTGGQSIDSMHSVSDDDGRIAVVFLGCRIIYIFIYFLFLPRQAFVKFETKSADPPPAIPHQPMDCGPHDKKTITTTMENTCV